jgi:hypothetical protein
MMKGGDARQLNLDDFNKSFTAIRLKNGVKTYKLAYTNAPKKQMFFDFKVGTTVFKQTALAVSRFASFLSKNVDSNPKETILNLITKIKSSKTDNDTVTINYMGVDITLVEFETKFSKDDFKIANVETLKITLGGDIVVDAVKSYLIDTTNTLFSEIATPPPQLTRSSENLDPTSI